VRPHKLPDGNAQATQGTLQTRTLRHLITLGYKNRKAYSDAVGVFAHKLLAPDDSNVILICKGSRSYGIVSCQAYLPNTAIAEKALLMLAYVPEVDASPAYYLFCPEEVIRKNVGFNERLKVKHINFNLELGVYFRPKSESPKLKMEVEGKIKDLMKLPNYQHMNRFDWHQVPIEDVLSLHKTHLSKQLTKFFT